MALTLNTAEGVTITGSMDSGTGEIALNIKQADNTSQIVTFSASERNQFLMLLNTLA